MGMHVRVVGRDTRAHLREEIGEESEEPLLVALEQFEHLCKR